MELWSLEVSTITGWRGRLLRSSCQAPVVRLLVRTLGLARPQVGEVTEPAFLRSGAGQLFLVTGN